MEYEDFNIRIVAKTDKGFKIQVDSPAGPASEEIALSDEIMDALKLIRTTGGIERGAATREAVYDSGDDESMTSEKLGGQLYDALFSGKVGKMYNRSYAALSDPEAGLRIKFHLNLDDEGVSELAQIPWEYIYEADTKEYLTLSRQTPIVRYIEVQRGAVPHAQPVKLKILVVMSSPNGVEALDLEKERKLIESNWANEENVDVDFLEHPTPDTLLQALVNNQYHVLHYMGHGAYDHKTGAGALILEDENQDAVMLDAQALGTWLRDAPSIRLIFLNACDTARTDEDEPFAGVANRLVMAGVPAVLAMQFPITDEAAIDFAAAFYPRLVAGFPVDEATSQGRKAILAGRTGTNEWGTPVLYMRAPDGYLFDKSIRPVEPAPDPIPDPTPVPVPDPVPDPIPDPQGGGVPWKIVGGVAAAIVAGIIYFLANLPGSKWQVSPQELELGKSTPISVSLLYEDGSKSAFDEDYIPTLKGSNTLVVSRLDEDETSWEWTAIADDVGLAEFKLEVSWADDSSNRDLHTFPVTVTLNPKVQKQFDESQTMIKDPTNSTVDALSSVADSLEQSTYMTPEMSEQLTLDQLSLQSLLDLRKAAERNASQQNIMLAKRVAALQAWHKAFKEARLADGPDSAEPLLQQLTTLKERLGRVNAESIIVCDAFNGCDSSKARIAKESQIFVQVVSDAEGLDCQLVAQGSSNGKECKPNISAWRNVNSAGDYYVELRNPEGDLVLKQAFTAH